MAKKILSANTCAYCLGHLELFGSAVDHVAPLSRGGPHILQNLTDACEPYNRAKGDPLVSEFRERLTGVARHLPPS
ncbi:HNH endonuclease signature motif containing protein [Deinococcus apachensis]|uniref:HNH endonuclease n=1 Tax=Deinococcus apachensis TaxID=309886 RepID=UPI00058AD0B5